ncbi:MAG TPA: hypothetical protein VF880_07255 [Actinomycetes bacterium]
MGPFDPVLHIRSRDHHRAICREAALLDLPSDSLPRRWAQESDADVLSLPDDVRGYYAAFIVHARAQLQAAGARS